MFEKVLRGRAERRPSLQLNAVSASVAAHAVCAAGFTAFSIGAARADEPAETATMLLLHAPVALAEVPAPRPDHPAPRPNRAIPATPASLATPPDPRPEPARVAGIALRAPTLTVDLPPQGGPALEAASLRGIGDLGLQTTAGVSGGGVTVGEDGGPPLVDSDILASPPHMLNKRLITRLMSEDYPSRLMFGGVEGRVLLAFIIGVDGRAEMENVEVLSATNDAFIRPALEGLRRMRFRPAELDGHRVRVRVSLPLVWRLPARS